MFTEQSLRCGGTKSHSCRPKHFTKQMAGQGKARQDFGGATLLYILWDFTVLDLAHILLRLGQEHGQFEQSSGGIIQGVIKLATR